MTPVLERNIRALKERRAREQAKASLADRISDAVTHFAGSMTFVVLHALVFGIWAGVNSGLLPILPKWDESFVILGTSASAEAIFLSTFVLISQNRMQHEVTKLVTLVAAIADKMGVESDADGEVDELKQDVAPEAVLDEIETKT
jgi:uncharacterized membrane protein